MSDTQITWFKRKSPLPAKLAAAIGATSIKLGRRLLAYENNRLEQFKAVASHNLLIIASENSQLPWVDAIIYLGCDPAATQLYMPTLLKPNLAVALLQKRCLQLYQQSPLAILPATNQIVALQSLQTIDKSSIRHWIRWQTK